MSNTEPTPGEREQGVGHREHSRQQQQQRRHTASAADAPQLTDVRREYVDGNLTQGELEAGVERALADGPPIGHDHTPTPPTGLDAITAGIAGLFIAPFVWFVDWRSDDSDVTYDWGQHHVTAIDREPDADDHPAESAGAYQWALKGLSTLLAFEAAIIADGQGLLGLSTALLVATLLVAFAPTPTVEAVERGLGRHTATGSHMDGDDS